MKRILISLACVLLLPLTSFANNNQNCTGSGTPCTCCTGSGTGTCADWCGLATGPDLDNTHTNPYNPAAVAITGGTVNVAQLNSQIINVFGYIPIALQANIVNYTSTNDVSSYVQSAINACPSGGCTITFPAGLYNVNNITMGNATGVNGTATTSTVNGIRLIGAGGTAGTTASFSSGRANWPNYIFTNPSTTGTIFTYNGSAGANTFVLSVNGGISRSGFKGISFNANHTASYGVIIVSPQGCKFEDFTVANALTVNLDQRIRATSLVETQWGTDNDFDRFSIFTSDPGATGWRIDGDCGNSNDYWHNKYSHGNLYTEPNTTATTPARFLFTDSSLFEYLYSWKPLTGTGTVNKILLDYSSCAAYPHNLMFSYSSLQTGIDIVGTPDPTQPSAEIYDAMTLDGEPIDPSLPANIRATTDKGYEINGNSNGNYQAGWYAGVNNQGAMQWHPHNSSYPVLDIDTAGLRVGIGTATPAYDLTVTNDSATSGPIIGATSSHAGAGTSLQLFNDQSGHGLNVFVAGSTNSNSRFGDSLAGDYLQMLSLNMPLYLGTLGSFKAVLGTNNLAAMTINTDQTVSFNKTLTQDLGTTAGYNFIAKDNVNGVWGYDIYSTYGGTDIAQFTANGNGEIKLGSNYASYFLNLYSKNTKIMELTDTNVKVDGTLQATSGGSTNHAVCWKANGVLGYCSAVVDSSGICGTCN